MRGTNMHHGGATLPASHRRTKLFRLAVFISICPLTLCVVKWTLEIRSWFLPPPDCFPVRSMCASSLSWCTPLDPDRDTRLPKAYIRCDFPSVMSDRIKTGCTLNLSIPLTPLRCMPEASTVYLLRSTIFARIIYFHFKKIKVSLLSPGRGRGISGTHHPCPSRAPVFSTRPWCFHVSMTLSAACRSLSESWTIPFHLDLALIASRKEDGCTIRSREKRSG